MAAKTIAKPAPAEVSVFDRITAVEVPQDTAQQWAQTLMAGKSDAAEAVAAHKGSDDEQVTNVAAVIAGARVLQSREASAQVGQAVACYILTRPILDRAGKQVAPGYFTGDKLAETLGLSKGRVSQFALEGAVYATLGLSEGWTRNAVNRIDLRKAISGSGMKQIRETVKAAKISDARKREAIAAVVAKATAPKVPATKPEPTGTDNPTKVEGPEDVTVEQVSNALARWEDAALILLGSVAHLDATARGVVEQRCYELLEAVSTK